MAKAEKRVIILLTSDAEGGIDGIHKMPTFLKGRCYSVNLSMAKQFIEMKVAAISVEPPQGVWHMKMIEGGPAEWQLVVSLRGGA